MKYQEVLLARGWPRAGLVALRVSLLFILLQCLLKYRSCREALDKLALAQIKELFFFAKICTCGAVPITGGCVIFWGRPSLCDHLASSAYLCTDTGHLLSGWGSWKYTMFLRSVEDSLWILSLLSFPAEEVVGQYFCILGKLLCITQQCNTSQFFQKKNKCSQQRPVIFKYKYIWQKCNCMHIRTGQCSTIIRKTG